MYMSNVDQIVSLCELKMKIELFALLFLCLGGMQAVNARSVDDRQETICFLIMKYYIVFLQIIFQQRHTEM